MMSFDFNNLKVAPNVIHKHLMLKKNKLVQLLHKYGEIGVSLFKDGTPKRTGTTANSWYYEVDDSSLSLVFKNSHINKGVNIAILIQYDHATGTGGYVKGIDYINPIMQKIISDMNSELKE